MLRFAYAYFCYAFFSYDAYFRFAHSPVALEEIRRRGKKVPPKKISVGPKMQIFKKINSNL
jgi:hypothetical protein